MNEILELYLDNRTLTELDKYDGRWITVRSQEMKKPDIHGNTHTVYQVNKRTKIRRYCGKAKFIKFENKDWNSGEKEWDKSSRKLANEIPF